MRIIGGRLKGQTLSISKRIRVTRPVVRKSVFDSLSPFFFSSVLDLCAGSGSMGLEGISRGAEYVLFVEKSRSIAKILTKNIERLGVADEADVIIGDARSIVKNLERKFDFIFLDPPYSSDMASKILKLIYRYSILNEDGVIVVESSKRMRPDFDRFTVMSERIKGETLISYLEISDEESNISRDI